MNLVSASIGFGVLAIASSRLGVSALREFRSSLTPKMMSSNTVI